jgi:ATP-dependent RNA helicase DDX19/DBP5
MPTDTFAQVLIATNVIARGIDVMSVNMVVNYDMPWDPTERRPDVETYLHRSRSCVMRPIYRG